MPLALEGLTSAALLYIIREASHVLKGCKARIIIYICIDCQLSNCLSSLQKHSMALLGSFLLPSLAAFLCIFAICLHWANKTVSLLQVSARSYLDPSSHPLAYSLLIPWPEVCAMRALPASVEQGPSHRLSSFYKEIELNKLKFQPAEPPWLYKIACEWDAHKKYNIRITILLHCWAFQDPNTSKWHLC